MKIELKRSAVSVKTIIPKGEYTVVCDTGKAEIKLVGGGKDWILPAVKRSSKTKSRTTSIVFYSGGGRLWYIVVRVPKFGEWIAMIEYEQELQYRAAS